MPAPPLPKLRESKWKIPPNPGRSRNFTNGHAIGTSARSQSPRRVSNITRPAVRVSGHDVSHRSAGSLVPKR